MEEPDEIIKVNPAGEGQPFWALLTRGGTLHRGAGPSSGLVNLLGNAVAAVFMVPGKPPIYVAGDGMDLLWTVTIIAGARGVRSWGVAVPAGARVWFTPTLDQIGIGKTVNSIQSAIQALNIAMSAKASS